MSQVTIESLLRALPLHPTLADLEPVVTTLVEKAAGKRVPLKSVAATLRAHRPDADLTDEIVAAIVREAGRFLREIRQTTQHPRVEAEYCGEVNAAAILGVTGDELRHRLIDPVQRRALGYPFWNGAEFRFPLAALRSATCHAYVAALPEHEPLPDLLPPWCRRG